MPNIKPRIRELARYAIAKRGAEQSASWCHYDVLDYPHVEVAGASRGEFFELDQSGELSGYFDLTGEGYYFRMPVLREALAKHRRQHPAIRESSYAERDGHIYLEVPVDADVPVAALRALIDEAYALVWSKLDAEGRMKIELAELPYDEPKLMDRLIETNRLQARRKEIRKLARKAILLRTRKSSEAKIPLGATKIGGRPDLPAKTEWPLFRTGKPLAFLAQLNLAQIAKVGRPIKGLPTEGLLSVFSVWGWMEPGEGDPSTPAEREDGPQQDRAWTVLLLTPRRARLQRRKTPRGVNSFRAAAVEPTLILSLPNHRAEPPLAALGWSDDEYRQFDKLQSDYRSLQMSHYFRNSDTFTSHHLLGGYALFQQQYPEELAGMGLTMLLQIGTDANTLMGWGDGGELTFYADAKALARGRFERIWATCQGG
jgi:uncharacterized protein YwqG